MRRMSRAIAGTCSCYPLALELNREAAQIRVHYGYRKIRLLLLVSVSNIYNRATSHD